MSLRLPSAVISTTRNGSPVLSSVPANIQPAKDKDQDVEGGIVQYIVRLDPANLPQTGDTLTIQSWATFSVDATEPYRVFSARPSGFRPATACIRVSIGQWVGR